MKKFRTGILALAATAAFAGGAAPASAAETTAAAGPPCTPSVPVPNALDCTFDIAAWAVVEVQRLPQTAIATAQAAAQNAIRTVNGTLVTAGEIVDRVEEQGVNDVCWLLFGTSAGGCVSF